MAPAGFLGAKIWKTNTLTASCACRLCVAFSLILFLHCCRAVSPSFVGVPCHAVQEVDGSNLEAWEKAHHDLLTSQVRYVDHRSIKLQSVFGGQSVS